MKRVASTFRRKSAAVALAGLATAVLCALAPVGLPPKAGHAQDEQPLVIFIQGRRPLETTGISNVGPEGLSKLADIFRSMGAEVTYRNITSPLPEDADVVVLARPMRAIGTVEAAYLWAYLERGGNALLALDPEGTYLRSPSVRGGNIRSRIGRGALPELFDADFGILPYDTFVAEPYVSNESVETINTVYSVAPVDGAPNPITAPLQQYNLPVWVWGARHMRVEPFVVGGQAQSMLYSDRGFGESSPDIFPTGRDAIAATAPVELNLGEDYTGRLNMGAIAMDSRTGARLAVLGDSEMIQNGFGLVSSGPTPRYPANRILTERLAAWLLGLPEEEWPGLPPGFSWVTLDGENADWPSGEAATAADSAGDSPQTAYDLQQVQGYADNRYVYLILRSGAAPEDGVLVTIPLAAEGPDAPAPRVVASAAGVVIEREGAATELVPDGAFATGSAIELRLPQRLFGERIAVAPCVHSEAGQEPLDCLDQPLAMPYSSLLAPFDWSLLDQPLGTVYTNGGVYIRTAPGTDARIAGTVYNGTTFAVLGRNADASWIEVQNSNYRGWIAAFLLTPNHDLTLLPDVSAPAS